MIWLKHKQYLLNSVLTVLLLQICVFSTAQVITLKNEENKNIQLIEHQYLKGNFELSSQSARQFLANCNEDILFNTPNINIEYTKYLLTLSAIKAELSGWEDSALSMIQTTTIPVYKQRIAFAVAQHYFQHNKLAFAIPYYESTGISNLSNDEIADEKFEMAYCYFNNRQFEKAEPLFSSIKEIKDGKYYKAGNYYYGLLAYNENKFQEALACFENIRNDKQYRTVVPYYIAETYYFVGDKDKALKEAVAILNNKKEKPFYDNELHLLAAQCLFEDIKYKEAKPYFEYFFENSEKIRKEDLYKMAYCYYRTNDWFNAIEKFKLLSSTTDSLGQTSMYLLGDCYLKTGDKKSARNAFGLCSDLSLNKGQQGASMMLYSMISYEMGYDDEATRQLKNLLTNFPETDYKDEANKLFSDLLLKTHDYENALKHLEKVKKKDNDYRKTYQKAAFGYAVDCFRKGDFVNSEKYFTFSLLHPTNADYETAAYFWKGELAYRLHNYDDVLTNLEEFTDRKGENKVIAQISPLATLQHAWVNMGFAYMQLQDYKEAQSYFNKAQTFTNGDSYSLKVACLHEADAVFMQKNYSKAIQLYNKIIISDSENADYAHFQKCIILGLQGKDNEKINQLQSIISQSPPSPYASSAKYEIAITYIEDDKYTHALKYLLELTDTLGDRTFGSRAWMKMGFIYQQQKNIDDAIDAYENVLIDYPTSEERMAAYDALKNIYIQNNAPDEFTAFLKDNDLPSADSGSIDSAYYAAAELLYSSGLWAKARDAFSNYLKKYPYGIFDVKAHYYRAECNYQLKNQKDAIADYKVVLDIPWNEYSENSAKHSAVISFEQNDYKSAYSYYLALRTNPIHNQTLEIAYSGLMKCSFVTGKTYETVAYADSLLHLPNINADIINEAYLYKANAMRINLQPNEALQLYLQLCDNKSGVIAAEARYHIAEIYLKQDSLQKAEKQANETIRQSAGFDYWIVKSYIILADILVKQKDYFNAKATLESIVKHTKIKDIKDEASIKLEDVKNLERLKSKVKD